MKAIFTLALLVSAASAQAANIHLDNGEVRNIGGHRVSCGGNSNEIVECTCLRYGYETPHTVTVERFARQGRTSEDIAAEKCYATGKFSSAKPSEITAKCDL